MLGKSQRSIASIGGQDAGRVCANYTQGAVREATSDAVLGYFLRGFGLAGLAQFGIT